MVQAFFSWIQVTPTGTRNQIRISFRITTLTSLAWAFRLQVVIHGHARRGGVTIGWSSNDLTNQVTRESHDPVASGGFADIYRGMLQQDNGRFIKVAIKAIKTYLDEDDNLSKKQRRLRREIKVWLDLSHDNILPLLGTTMGFGRFPAMVCPWVENGTLTVYLKHCYDNLSVVEILVLYLHSCSIVHGDLSRSNILIHGNGRACIADFGLSTVLTEFGRSTFTTSCHARGTLRWIAPELLDLEIPEDETGEESPHVAPATQSDVYSFGSIMLQILSGQVPYHYYKHDGQVVLAISKGKMPRCPSSELVTERRWTFIQRCWSTVDIVRSRPSSEEIVAFIDQELVDCRLREILTPTALEDVDNPWPPAQVTVESTATRSQLPPDETSIPVLRPPQPLPSRETVTPGVIVDPWHRSRIPVESITTSPHLSPNDPAPTRSLLDIIRQHQHSGQRGSIPNTIVELPSQPETIPSESPELESPELVISETADRLLPQNDASWHPRTSTKPQTTRVQLDLPLVTPGSDYRPLPLQDSLYDTVRTTWVPGIIPSSSGNGRTSTSTFNANSGLEGDRHRAYPIPLPT
ncbi:kinase-like domain-containing protein [Boletus reticuloceps]|uniref:Kinase-like domain-containing protein n=1 Tax=Boletus reticuloceps TaxID=495285 RepID=A0A8I2YS05_9AGAM|nr:kinase-like domain-containing protein [Boletus reticuloceps]